MAKKESNINKQEGFSKVSISWYPGHMAKSKKQIINDLKIIDIVVEVLDARAPKSSQNPDVNEYCKNKKRIMVLNKMDLADDKTTDEWIVYFNKNKIPSVKVQGNNQQSIKQLLSEIKNQSNSIKQENAKKGRTGYSPKIIIVGIPNVGKSTIINSLIKKKIQKVENKPGVTQKNQWINMNNEFELLDTPGMFSPKFENSKVGQNLSFLNTIGSNAIDNFETAYNLLKFLVENYKQNVEERYKIEIQKTEDNDLVYEAMIQIAKKTGCISAREAIDEEKVSNTILRDFRTGKLGKISLERPKE